MPVSHRHLGFLLFSLRSVTDSAALVYGDKEASSALAAATSAVAAGDQGAAASYFSEATAAAGGGWSQATDAVDDAWDSFTSACKCSTQGQRNMSMLIH